MEVMVSIRPTVQHKRVTFSRGIIAAPHLSTAPSSLHALCLPWPGSSVLPDAVGAWLTVRPLMRWIAIAVRRFGLQLRITSGFAGRAAWEADPRGKGVSRIPPIA